MGLINVHVLEVKNTLDSFVPQLLEHVLSVALFEEVASREWKHLVQSAQALTMLSNGVGR